MTQKYFHEKIDRYFFDLTRNLLSLHSFSEQVTFLQTYRSSLIGKVSNVILAFFFLNISFVSSYLAVQVPINDTPSGWGAYYDTLIDISEIMQDHATHSDTSSMTLGLEDDIDLFYSPYDGLENQFEPFNESNFSSLLESLFAEIYLETVSPPPKAA